MHAHGAMQMHGEAEFLPELRELVYAGLGAAAEAEVAALMQRANLEPVDEDLLNKVAGAHVGKLGIEGQHKHSVNARGSEQPQAFVEEGKQARRLGGAKKLLGVRIEGDGKRTGAQGLRFGNNGGEDLPMAEVHAVKVADGRDRRAEIRGQLGERTEDGSRALAHRLTASVMPS